jgi:16S rRNA processing protein RimM
MDRIALGIVKTVHGVRGELKVRSFSGETDHFRRLAHAWLERPGGAEARLMKVRSVRPQGRDVLIAFEGVDNPEEGRDFIGLEVWAEREFAAPRAEGEFYAADLCRCSLFFEGRRIGPVTSIFDCGSSTMLEILDGDGKTRLVPFLDRFIGEVDVERGRIVLREDAILK